MRPVLACLFLLLLVGSSSGAAVSCYQCVTPSLLGAAWSETRLKLQPTAVGDACQSAPATLAGGSVADCPGLCFTLALQFMLRDKQVFGRARLGLLLDEY